jgi:hypothetical protein
MTTIRKINVSEIEGRSLNDIDKSRHPQGQMALYNENDNGRNVWKLRLPEGGVISEGIVTENPTIELTPAGPDAESQKLVIKGGAPIGEETHLHLTTGNLQETSVFLGTDEHNVRTKIDGSVELTSYDYDNEETYRLNFKNNVLKISSTADEGDEDLYIKAEDDLYLDALDDDIHLRADDDIRIQVGYNFEEDDYQAQWVFRTSDESGPYLEFPDGFYQRTAYAGGNGQMMFIDTNRTGDYTENGSADKPFKTFAAAIAAAEESDATAYTFVLMGCTVTEDVDFTGTTFTQITISTACRSVITGNITIASIPTLSQLVIRNIEVGGTFTLTGDGTSEQMNNCSFYNTSFSGAVNITATNATAFYEAAFFSAVNFTNLSYLYINGAQFNADWTITADSDGVIPSRGINPGTGGSIAIVFSTIANNVIFVKGGTAAYVFQPHMSRMGVGAGTYTIPAGWTVTPHSTVLRGTWVNNGTLALRNSSHDNPIGGSAPSYVGSIGAASLKFQDGTTQTTAWSGGRVVAVPGSSTGAEGDKAGDIAFSPGHLYYCFEDYDSGISYNTTLSNITEDDNKFIFAKDEGIIEPEIGWSITVDVGGENEETHTITNVEDLATDWRVTWSGGNVTFDPGTAIRIFSTNIWKRVAWSNDTW